MHKIISLSQVSDLMKDIIDKLMSIQDITTQFERERACSIILKYIVPPDNDGYWANDLLKDIINQIRGE